LVQAFYARAAAGAAPSAYPQVEDDRMTSLEERSVVGAGGSAVFAHAVQEAVHANRNPQETAAPAGLFRMPEADALEAMCAQLKKRYALP
ncbi:hypothetical protein K0U00_48390, partial [Paenibacillus sepulcri]|nr:hypothetical protein [Paenibacillus sepulcri]